MGSKSYLPIMKQSASYLAVLVNLWGEKKFTGVPFYKGLNQLLQIPGIYAQLFGKGQTKPIRKLEHITIIDSNMQKAKEKASEVKGVLKVKAK